MSINQGWKIFIPNLDNLLSLWDYVIIIKQLQTMQKFIKM